MVYYGITDTGKVRKVNQDVFLARSDEASGVVFLVVCDGMGGARAGNVASELAAGAFMEHVMARPGAARSVADLMQHMQGAVAAANRRVYERSQSDPECAGMGTTLVAAAVSGENVVIANVGDSRAYHITPAEMTQVTKDHSVVEDMIARGDLKRWEASSHPNRNLITRALGTSSDTEPDLFFLNLQRGEHLLLCTDGLTNVVPEEDIFHEVNSGRSLEETCRRLIQLANDNGSPDNVTAVLLAM